MDADVRIEALGSEITYDVSDTCWLFNALSLDQYQDADATEGWVAVPLHVLLRALGRAFVAHGDDSLQWYAVDSMPSDTLLNHIAINAREKGFAIKDGGDNDSVVVYESVWHMRAALGDFVRQHADYSGDDNSFLVAGEEDRYDATQDSFTAAHLLDLNLLVLSDLMCEQHLDAWSLLLWVLGATPEQPDEARNSAFSVAWLTLKEAARLMSPHLAAGSTACMVAEFLRAGEHLPPDMLNNQSDLAVRLRWIGAVGQFANPTLRTTLLQSHFTQTSLRYEELTRWTGGGPGAYTIYSNLMRILLPGATLGFESLPQINELLLDHGELYGKMAIAPTMCDTSGKPSH